MSKITLPFLVLLLLFSCSKKKPELILTAPNEQNHVENEQDRELVEDQSKPLIVIAPEDTLKIMVRGDGAPGMYLGEDGEVHGFYVDLDRLIMEEMGQAYEFIAYDDIGPLFYGLKTGIYHSALAAPDLPDYHRFLNLSNPYEMLHFTTFVQKDNRDISGKTREEMIQSLHNKKIGVQIQGHIYQALINEREIEMIEYPTTTSALADLDKGLLDAVPDVERIGLYYAEKNGWKIKPVGGPIISHKITTGFSKMVETSVLDRYNSALKTIQEDGRYKTLYESYFGELSPRDLP